MGELAPSPGRVALRRRSPPDGDSRPGRAPSRAGNPVHRRVSRLQWGGTGAGWPARPRRAGASGGGEELAGLLPHSSRAGAPGAQDPVTRVGGPRSRVHPTRSSRALRGHGAEAARSASECHEGSLRPSGPYLASRREGPVHVKQAEDALPPARALRGDRHGCSSERRADSRPSRTL